MKKIVTAVIVTIALFSCEPAATFDKPQPDNVKIATSFPEKLQGNYLSEDQASIMTIEDTLITRHFDYECKVPRDSLDSTYKLQGDTLYDVTDGSKIRVSIKGDTIITHEDWTDTLFVISPDNILKKCKGYYFLNMLYDTSAWEVKKISLRKGILTMAEVDDRADIQLLKEITETTDDTISTHFTLTRHQFETFIKEGGFRKYETFRRIRKNN